MEKFKEIATIYYITRFDNYKLQEYTETNLEKNEIFNFNKVTYDNNFSENDELNFSISIIKTLRTWLEKSSEKYVIISTDDIDYEYIDYFHFDWNCLMNNLPYDMDSLQLGFEDKLEILPCFLHPVKDSYGFGMTLIKRRYAEKLVKLYYVNGEYKFNHKISNVFWKRSDNFVTPHYFLNQSGRGYSIPMFPRNPDLVNDKYFMRESLQNHKKLYSLWWKKLRDTRSLDNFFCYSTFNDLILKLPEEHESKITR
jgi:hypothetical protein